MAGEFLGDFDLRQERNLRDPAAADYGGGGSGGGPGERAGGVLSVSSGRVSKKKGKDLLDKAKLEAEMVRQQFKEMRKKEQGKKEAIPAPGGEINAELQSAAKYENRLQINRRSAAASRVRREAYINALERNLVELEEKFNSMCDQLEAANEENARLKGLFVSQNSAVEIPGFPDIDTFLNDGF